MEAQVTIQTVVYTLDFVFTLLDYNIILHTQGGNHQITPHFKLYGTQAPISSETTLKLDMKSDFLLKTNVLYNCRAIF